MALIGEKFRTSAAPVGGSTDANVHVGLVIRGFHNVLIRPVWPRSLQDQRELPGHISPHLHAAAAVPVSLSVVMTGVGGGGWTSALWSTFIYHVSSPRKVTLFKIQHQMIKTAHICEAPQMC